MTTLRSITMSSPVARSSDDTIRLATTVAIRLAGALTVFAGLILTTQALTATSSLITMIYWQQLEPLADLDINMGAFGGMTVFSTLGSALVVVVWGALLTALARPLARFVIRDR